MSSLSEIILQARKIKASVKDPQQIRDIVSVEKWLAPYYVGSFYYYMYDWWKKVFCTIVNKEFTEIVLGGSLSCGKSSIGELLILRKIYELSCYKNIPALFGLPPTSQLVFMYLSVSVQQSARTGFGRLMRIIDDSPYMSEHFPRDIALNSSISFKKTSQIACFAGSDVPHFISMDLFGVILDESNFLKGAGGDVGAFNKAVEIYRESTNRRKGRFIRRTDKGAREHGISVIISSANTSNSFTESRIKAGQNNPLFYSKNTSILDVKRAEFSEDEFYVFIGIDNFDPFILSEDNRDLAEAFFKSSGVPEESWRLDKPPDEVKESFRPVPIDFLNTFEVDVVNSLKEVLGLSVAKRMRLYYSKANWKKAIDPDRKHPFRSKNFVVSTKTSDNELIEQFLPDEIIFRRDCLYFAHIDQSVNGDATGIALTHLLLSEFRQLEKVVIDFMLQIIAPKDISAEIDISKIRDFYLYLQKVFKIKYGKISYDSYASRESLQHFSKAGVEVGLLSVDRDDTQYREICHLLNKAQISMYEYSLFEWEFFNLVHFLDKRKVDHEQGFSKDLSDAVAGSCFNAISSLGLMNKDQAKKDNIAAFLGVNKKSNFMDQFSIDTEGDKKQMKDGIMLVDGKSFGWPC